MIFSIFKNNLLSKINEFFVYVALIKKDLIKTPKKVKSWFYTLAGISTFIRREIVALMFTCLFTYSLQTLNHWEVNVLFNSFCWINPTKSSTDHQVMYPSILCLIFFFNFLFLFVEFSFAFMNWGIFLHIGGELRKIAHIESRL